MKNPETQFSFPQDATCYYVTLLSLCTSQRPPKRGHLQVRPPPAHPLWSISPNPYSARAPRALFTLCCSLWTIVFGSGRNHDLVPQIGLRGWFHSKGTGRKHIPGVLSKKQSRSRLPCACLAFHPKSAQTLREAGTASLIPPAPGLPSLTFRYRAP